MKSWRAQKYAGNASIGLGLINAMASFGLFITRKNDGETAIKWLGSDDYMVMSCMMLGGLLMVWGGRAAYKAGFLEDKVTNSTGSQVRSVRAAGNKELDGSYDISCHSYMKQAYRTAVAASLVFFAMSFYALLGGFNNTPIPESHIGPNQDNNTQLSVFCLLYGITSLLSIAVCAVSGGRLRVHADIDEQIAKRSSIQKQDPNKK